MPRVGVKGGSGRRFVSLRSLNDRVGGGANGYAASEQRLAASIRSLRF
ncbi:hypothetical protein [Microbacterium sp.]